MARGRRRALLLTVSLLAGAVAAVAGCGRPDPVDARMALLESERRALERYLAVDPSEPIVPPGDVLVVVRGRLVAELLGSILPLDASVGEYRLRLDSAEVALRPGLARVRLTGRASPVSAPSIFAEVALLGTFELEPRPREGAGLGGRVRVLGIETRDVGVGTLSPPAERLVDGLARLRMEALGDAVGRVQIPVRLVEVLDVPALEEDQATIPAARLPVRFELEGVRVLEEGIVVSLRVEREWTNVPRWMAGGLGKPGR